MSAAAGKRLTVLSPDPAFGRSLSDRMRQYVDVPIDSSTLGNFEDVTPGNVVVLLNLPTVARQEARKWMERLVRSGVFLILVDIDHDSITVGPLLSPSEPGCARCIETWSRNEFSSLSERRQAAPGIPANAPLTLLVLAPILAGFVGARDTGSVLVLNSLTLECVRRSFIPHPACSRCGSRVKDSPTRVPIPSGPRLKLDNRVFRAGPPPETARLLERFHNRHTGLVRHLIDHLSSDCMPMAFASFLADGSTAVFENGYGRASTWRESRTVAVLEALERFCGYMPRGKKTVVRGSYAALHEKAVDPASFILHGRDQRLEAGYRYPLYSEELEYDWVWGYSFRRNEPVLVPEQLVYYRLPDSANRPTNRFVYEVSNGCAVGGSLEEAALHGLFEIIERDSFMATWYTRISPVPLDIVDANNPDITALVALAEAQGYELSVFDLASEFGVAAVWAMIVNPVRNAPVKAYCAAGASFDPEKAVFSALVEVCTSIRVYEETFAPMRDKAEAMVKDGSLVQSMEDHVLLYSHEDAFPRFDFLPKGGAKVPMKERFDSWYANPPGRDLHGDLVDLVQNVLAIANDVIVVDQGFAPLNDLGLRCVKVLAPGLLPVTFGHQYRRISHARLEQYAANRGVAFHPADINPYPHNFP